MDDELRNRYRRDFSKETARPSRPQQRSELRPTVVPAKPRQHPGATRPVMASVKSAKHQHRPAAPETPQNAISQPPPKKQKKRRRRRLLIILILVLLIAGAGAGVYWHWFKKAGSPIPVSVTTSVNFPLLYPAQLPAGYHINQSSYSVSSNVVLFSAVNASGTKIAFTDQQRPSKFDYNKFYTSGLSNSSIFNAPLGQAAIGTTSGKLLGSLATSQCWMLVSSASKSVKSADLKLILENLKSTQ